MNQRTEDFWIVDGCAWHLSMLQDVADEVNRGRVEGHLERPVGSHVPENGTWKREKRIY